MKWKARLASWLRPFPPATEWANRTIWHQKLDEVADAISDRRYDEIEKMLRQLERELPGYSSDAGTKVGRLTRLGELYQDLAGNFGEAERLFRQAVELGESSSVDFLTIALPMNDLGLLLTNQRRYGEAEPVLEQLASRTKGFFGEDHPEYASCLENLAAVYRQTGRSSQASRIRAHAVRIRKDERARAWSNE